MILQKVSRPSGCGHSCVRAASIPRHARRAGPGAFRRRRPCRHSSACFASVIMLHRGRGNHHALDILPLKHLFVGSADVHSLVLLLQLFEPKRDPRRRSRAVFRVGENCGPGFCPSIRNQRLPLRCDHAFCLLPFLCGMVSLRFIEIQRWCARRVPDPLAAIPDRWAARSCRCNAFSAWGCRLCRIPDRRKPAEGEAAPGNRLRSARRCPADIHARRRDFRNG